MQAIRATSPTSKKKALAQISTRLAQGSRLLQHQTPHAHGWPFPSPFLHCARNTHTNPSLPLAHAFPPIAHALPSAPAPCPPFPPMSLALVAAAAALLLYAVVWSVGLVGTATIFLRYSSRRTRGPVFPSPQQPWGVSILRPLKGLDPLLEECLESAFRQEYPLFEIILSVADAEDPAVQVAKHIIAKYPNIPARLIIGTTPNSPGSTFFDPGC